MAAQSLKTVYLKIAAMIHPDREQDETKKEKKTELFQQASQAYEQQDLFYLLKLQLQLEQNKGSSSKALSAEQVKLYQLALEGQSQKLAHGHGLPLFHNAAEPEVVKTVIEEGRGLLKAALRGAFHQHGNQVQVPVHSRGHQGPACLGRMAGF